MADTQTKPQTEDSVKNGSAKKNPNSSTQTFLKIAEIRDNTVVLKNGGLRGVLSVASVNFNLKSEEEQNSITYSYQGFLNTLEFPIQIVVKSKKLDIDEYLEKLKKTAQNQTNKLLQKQTFEYIEYVGKLVEYADIMSKEFYVIVPFDPARSAKPNFIEKIFAGFNQKDSYSQVRLRHQEFEELKKGLNQRMSTVKIGLENCGLKIEELDTKNLIELFYNIYNPTVARYEKLKDPTLVNITSDEDKIATEEKA